MVVTTAAKIYIAQAICQAHCSWCFTFKSHVHPMRLKLLTYFTDKDKGK